MAKKSNSPWGAPAWAALAGVLLVLAWLMQSFPAIVFVAYAPVFVILDKKSDQKPAWEHFEWILIPLACGFLAAGWPREGWLYLGFVQAIIGTLVFVAYSFCRESLGPRLGKATVILFWLAAEYVLVSLPWRHHFIFLADAIALWPTWTNWTVAVGYLAISLWIWLCNLAAYEAVLTPSKMRWGWAICWLLLVSVPIGWAYAAGGQGIDRAQMIAWHTVGVPPVDRYAHQGEVVARTAAWLSVLVLLVGFVRHKVKKK
ncbi:MAG: hypothetical protein MUC38_01825 [Cyclobacteriaceae bacterium]|jgi:hypothetical protein|nr:hypothetical protein [Cyclobacteriaceae bacterium]